MPTTAAPQPVLEGTAPEVGEFAADWPTAGQDYDNSRTAASSTIKLGPVPPSANSAIVQMVTTGVISGKTAKDVLDFVWVHPGEDPKTHVEARGLVQVTDMGAIEKAVDEVIAANPDKAEQAKQKPALGGWFVGQVMKATGGKASPQAVNALVKQKLGIE